MSKIIGERKETNGGVEEQKKPAKSARVVQPLFSLPPCPLTANNNMI